MANNNARPDHKEIKKIKHELITTYYYCLSQLLPKTCGNAQSNDKYHQFVRAPTNME
jgi:hypothetical protein